MRAKRENLSTSQGSVLRQGGPVSRQGGLGLVEGVIAVAIVGTALVVMVGVFHQFLRTALRSTPELKAIFLMEEGLEAIRAIRDVDWQTEIDPLVLGTQYHLIFENGRWEATTTPSYIDGVYERIVILSSVNRDTDGRIVASGGTTDTNTKEITVSVSWSSGEATTTKTVLAYIMDVFTE